MKTPFAVAASVLFAASLHAQSLLTNPGLANDAAGWQRGDATTTRMSPGTNGGIDLATLSPATGGLIQCVSLTDIQPGSALDAGFTVTPLENTGGARGLVSFYSQPDCAGSPASTTTLQPEVETTRNALGTPVMVSGRVTVPAGSASARFWMLVYHLVPTIPFVVNLKEPQLEPAVPMGRPNIFPQQQISFERFRRGERALICYRFTNRGNAPTTGPFTVSVTIPPPFRLSCSQTGADHCVGGGSNELLLRFEMILEPGSFVSVCFDVDVPPDFPISSDVTQAALTLMLSGGGDPDPFNFEGAMVVIEPPRQAERETPPPAAPVNGRTRQ